jgi:flotillin
MDAEAKGLFEILTKQAEGYDQVVKAAGGDTNSAFQLLILEKLPELVKTQVEAVKVLRLIKLLYGMVMETMKTEIPLPQTLYRV